MNAKNLIIITTLLILIVGIIFLVAETKKPELSQNNLEIDDGTGIDIDNVKNELSFPDNTLDTSDWEVYYNEMYRFELKYPKGWQLRNYDYPDSIVAFYDKRIEEGADNGIYVEVKDIKINNYINSAHIKDIIHKYEKVSINNTQGYYFSNSLSENKFAISYFSENISYDRTYIIYVIKPSIANDYDKIFEKVLTSFKYIE